MPSDLAKETHATVVIHRRVDAVYVDSVDSEVLKVWKIIIHAGIQMEKPRVQEIRRSINLA